MKGQKKMQRQLNQATLIGNVGNDLQLRHTKKGDPVTNIRLATNERWTNKDGKREERTEWHNVTVFGKTAEHCVEYLAKGREIHVTGRLRTNSYELNGTKFQKTEIVASAVRFLGGRPAAKDPEPVEAEVPQADSTDEVPF